MSGSKDDDTPTVEVPPREGQVEARHLEAEEYDDHERVDPPDWYDDTINVGDEQ